MGPRHRRKGGAVGGSTDLVSSHPTGHTQRTSAAQPARDEPRRSDGERDRAPRLVQPLGGYAGRDANEADGVDELGVEHLLTGPFATYFHLAIGALAAVLYTSPMQSPCVWSEDVQMQPGTMVQETVWHISDTLIAVGFEASVAFGLAAAVSVMLLVLLYTVSTDSGGERGEREGDATDAAVQGRSPTRCRTPDEEAVAPSPDDVSRAGSPSPATQGEDPPILLALLAFVAGVAFMAWSDKSLLYVDPGPLTIHANVAAENAKLRAEIATLQRIAAAHTPPSAPEL
eukprot:m.222324 g.222324  ORF g.222324 m.222324 type:complete len:286 (-) comp32460_c0_seq1:197-1054(-)